MHCGLQNLQTEKKSMYNIIPGHLKKTRIILTKIIVLKRYDPMAHLYQHFLSIVLLDSAHELVQKICIFLNHKSKQTSKYLEK